MIERGTAIKNIHLTDDPDEIEGRTDDGDPQSRHGGWRRDSNNVQRFGAGVRRIPQPLARLPSLAPIAMIRTAPPA